MDPDMVRQQEEAEAASLLRRKAPEPAVAPPPPAPPEAEPLAAQDERRQDVIVSRRSAKAVRRLGWFAALRAGIYCLILSALGLLAGIMIGVKLNLVASQSLGIGAGLGFVLGWQSIFASIRANGKLSFLHALAVSILPAAIIVVALIMGMLAASTITGVSAETLAGGHLRNFWIIVGASGLLGVVLAASRLRKTPRY